MGGGVAAGVTDALIKSVTVLATGHLLALLADARLYVLIAVGLLTYTIQQNGYRAAGLAAFLPAFSVLEPVTGSLLGLVIYHERLTDGPVQITVELAACAAMTWGIVRLAGSDMVSGAHPAAGPAPIGPRWPAPPILPSPARPVHSGYPARPVHSPSQPGRSGAGHSPRQAETRQAAPASAPGADVNATAGRPTYRARARAGC